MKTDTTLMPISWSTSIHNGASRHKRGSLSPHSGTPSKSRFTIMRISSRAASAAALVCHPSGSGLRSYQYSSSASNNWSLMRTTSPCSQKPLAFIFAGLSRFDPRSMPTRLRQRVSADVPLRCIPSTNTQVGLADEAVEFISARYLNAGGYGNIHIVHEIDKTSRKPTDRWHYAEHEGIDTPIEISLPFTQTSQHARVHEVSAASERTRELETDHQLGARINPLDRLVGQSTNRTGELHSGQSLDHHAEPGARNALMELHAVRVDVLLAGIYHVHASTVRQLQVRIDDRHALSWVHHFALRTQAFVEIGLIRGFITRNDRGTPGRRASRQRFLRQ